MAYSPDNFDSFVCPEQQADKMTGRNHPNDFSRKIFQLGAHPDQGVEQAISQQQQPITEQQRENRTNSIQHTCGVNWMKGGSSAL